MILGAVAIGGGLSVGIGLRFVIRTFRQPPHVRENFRGHQVVATAGIVLALPIFVGVAFVDGMTVPTTMAAVGVVMAVLGFVDDVRGDRRAGGFAGHVRALLHGHVTTGLMKAVGGGVTGLAAGWVVGHHGPWILVAGAIVALSANLTNLLDLRPGRALKVWFPCAVALLVAGIPEHGDRVLAALAGGAVVFVYGELRERIMLGDTGAGLLGAVIGVAATATLGRSGLLVLLIVLVVATLTSEIVSFSRVIEAVPPLRWADRLGRSG